MGDARDAALPDALRAYLRGQLPDFMVPSAIVVVDALPMTPNGKVDVAALPTPDASPTQGYEAPRTATEAALAEIWAEVLGVERVGIHDEFFALGGHSLLVAQVMWRVRDALGLTAPVSRFFLHPTVAQLAEVLTPVPATASRIRRVARSSDAVRPTTATGVDETALATTAVGDGADALAGAAAADA